MGMKYAFYFLRIIGLKGWVYVLIPRVVGPRIEVFRRI
jgi:hypothetical protein